MEMVDFMARLSEENKKLTGAEWAVKDILVLKRNPLLNTSHLENLSKDLDKKLS